MTVMLLMSKSQSPYLSVAVEIRSMGIKELFLSQKTPKNILKLYTNVNKFEKREIRVSQTC